MQCYSTGIGSKQGRAMRIYVFTFVVAIGLFGLTVPYSFAQNGETEVGRILDLLGLALQQQQDTNVDKLIDDLAELKFTFTEKNGPLLEKLSNLCEKMIAQKPVKADRLKTLFVISNSWIPQGQIPQSWNAAWFDEATRLLPAFGLSQLFLDRVQKVSPATLSRANPEIALWMSKVACFALRLKNRIADCDKILDILLDRFAQRPILYEIVMIEKAKNLRDTGQFKKAIATFHRAQSKLIEQAEPSYIKWTELHLAEMALSTGQLDVGTVALDKHEEKVRSDKGSFPWERLYAKTLRMQLLRKQKRFAEAVTYGIRIKKEYEALMTGSLQAWIWFDLERFYVYALLGDTKSAAEVSESLRRQLEQIPSLLFLQEIPRAILKKSTANTPHVLSGLKRNLGPNHHVYLDALSVIHSLGEKSQK